MFSLIFVINLMIFWLLSILYFPIKIIGFVLGFFIGVILAWVVVFIVFFFCMIIIKYLPLNHFFRQKVFCSIAKLVIRFFRIKIVVYNSHLIPLKNKLIIYANHKSYFDPFMISCVFPRNITFSPKDEFYHHPFYGWFLTFCFNAFRCLKIVRRDNRETVKNINKAIDNIKRKLALVIFPEGGVITENTDQIISSLDGAYKIAIKSEADILPITLKGSSKMHRKCWFRLKKVELFIHPCIPFIDYQYKNTQQINQHIKNIINSVL
ncbi:lysophospholipid acyltransferase family protein [Candidatus Phytoplasma melaleucae]|uniref:1-acyl-sn-glycerol-3-phosphate acyltransferase n=1 Tax=Candidatus Phytoplasma melaleucae TaxID=2982630 RepID=A0ABT9DCS7_9MOLU|nr:lysophospholipid acyltransferase family protein ['Melaleuca sp.' phytoplasma]MDO8167915.1 1-acyl-sn-glycerol-3-phosphate acyltransferase ['Melaleuca sp.' phytoplasma]